MRKVLLSSIVALLLATGLALPQAPSSLIVVHTNDMHGQVLPREGGGGMAELATAIRRERPDLILDGGDMFTGTMISDEFWGKPIIEILNKIGYSAVALGNHEFDYGVPELRKRLQEARFPVLSANVAGIPEVKPYTVLTVKGLRIGIIGLTVDTLPEVTHPKNLANLKVTKVVDALRETLPKVRPLADLIFLVVHVPFDDQIQLAREFPEIRLIVAGHPHTSRATQVGQTLIVETGSSTQNIGKVEIRLNGTSIESMTSQSIAVRGVAKDPEIQAIIAPYERQISSRSAEQVGEATANLTKSDSQESALNNMLADALRDHAGTQIAFHNIGGIRAPLRRGPITKGDIFDVLPFQNTLVKMNLSGVQLKQLLGRRVLAVSGLKVAWDMTRPYPNRLVSVTLTNGEPIQDATRYTVATNDFVASGGDGLVELTQGTSIEDTGILLRDAVAAYLKKNPIVAAAIDGRVTIRTP
jgi:2',3'-cyclic-nucleotide 2'-phosphodiesterase (5'-nucleotidase family)